MPPNRFNAPIAEMPRPCPSGGAFSWARDDLESEAPWRAIRRPPSYRGIAARTGAPVRDPAARRRTHAATEIAAGVVPVTTCSDDSGADRNCWRAGSSCVRRILRSPARSPPGRRPQKHKSAFRKLPWRRFDSGPGLQRASAPHGAPPPSPSPPGDRLDPIRPDGKRRARAALGEARRSASCWRLDGRALALSIWIAPERHRPIRQSTCAAKPYPGLVAELPHRSIAAPGTFPGNGKTLSDS